MKKDKYKTKVKFLVNEEQKKERGIDVFAFFPEDKYNDEKGLFTCYQHVGQHSACHIEYANKSRKATLKERKDLIEELESIGYNLEIVN